MALFSISSYDAEGNCKICGSPASEIHKEGCELGAVYVEIKKMRLVIEQFLKLLGVETITSAFAKIAAEQSVHVDGACTHPHGEKIGEHLYCPNCDDYI